MEMHVRCTGPLKFAGILRCLCVRLRALCVCHRVQSVCMHTWFCFGYYHYNVFTTVHFTNTLFILQ